MNNPFAAVFATINALQTRERLILWITLVAVCVGAWDHFLMQPLQREEKTVQTKLRNVRTTILVKEQELIVALQRQDSDPNKAIRDRIKKLKTGSSDLEKSLQRKALKLIKPTEVANLLQQLLESVTTLTLFKLEGQEAQPLFANAGENKQKRVPIIFKHGMMVEFKGDYNGVIKYLHALENLPWNIYWEGVELKIEAYPQIHAIISIYTLSLYENWIGL